MKYGQITLLFGRLNSAPTVDWALRVSLLVALLGGVAPFTAAQPVDFGSADAPREQLQAVWWRPQNTFDAATGFSLISDHWRAGVDLTLSAVSPRVTARMHGTLRGGIYGRYEPDTDEWYDVLRLLEFARYTPPPPSRLYLRAGLIDRMRLGTGHLVNFFNSYVAWDERTVGVEAMYGGDVLNVAAFTDNVLVDGVIGGRAALRPLFLSRSARLRSLEIGVNHVTDLSTRTSLSEGVTGYNVDVSVDALASGDIRLAPFVSYAWYPEYGSGVAFGADVASDNFIDLARFRMRMALYYNGAEFIPGYVGSFYRVSNPTARILNADRFLATSPAVRYEGVELKDALGGNALESELRLLIFDRFELWYYFRRHYGTQSLSEYHLRLYVHQRNRLRVNIGLDRAGLRSFFSLFNEMGDQSALVFGTDYRWSGPFWIFVNARYTFEEVAPDPDGTRQYLVQRRFEPFGGVRFAF